MKNPHYPVATWTLLVATVASGQVHGADAAAADADSQGLGDVVVTANRYSSNLEKTPLAITELNAAALAQQNIDQSRDLTARVPDLEAPLRSNTETNVIYFIRGIGNKDTKYDPAVSIYVDDVYVPRSWGTTADIPDLQSIEVLRGPQGTVYGRNNTGGAIMFSTLMPQYQINGSLNLSGGTDADLGAGGFITAPLIEDKIAFSLATEHRHRDGYTHDVTLNKDVNDIDLNFLRGKLRFDPVGQLRVLWSVDYLRDRSDPTVPVPKYQPNGVNSGSYDPNMTWVSRRPAQHLDVYGTSLSFDYTLSSADTLRWIGSWRGFQGPTQLFYDGGTSLIIQELQDDYHQHDWTSEITYTGHHGPVDMTAGLFVFNELFANKRYYETAGKVADAGTITLTDARLETDSYAGYAQAELHLDSAWTLTAGGRYTWEERAFNDAGYVSTSTAFPAFFTPVTPNPGTAFNFAQAKNWDAFSPKVALNYQLTPDVMAYTSWTRGFRSGAYDVYASSLKTAKAPVSPETVRTVEGGLKTEFLSHTLRVNLAGFRNYWDDLQISAYDTTINTTRLLNGGNAYTEGGELEATWQPVKHFELSESLGYLDTGYSRFTAALPSNPANATTLIGKRLPYSPHFTSNTAAWYDIPCGSAGAIGIGGNLRYIQSLYLDVYNSPEQLVPNEYFMDLALSYRDASDRWSAEARVTNVLDRQYDQGGAYSATLGPHGSWYQILNEPREATVTLHYNY